MTPDWSAKPVTVPYAKFDDPQTLNLYSYTENAPINRIDADGHFNDPFGVLSGGAGTGWSNIESPVRFTISVTHTYTTTTVTLPGGARFTRTNDQSETQVSLYRGPVSGQGEELFTVTITYADGTKEHRTGKGHPRRDNNPGDIEYGPFARAAGASRPPALPARVHQDQSASRPNGPEALVRSLYTQVLARHPLGVPDDTEMKAFTPFLSKALLHRMDLAIACGADWYRQNPEPHLKPALGWLELGPFSGDNERASPQTFLIQRTQSEKDGFFRVYVRLTRAYPEGTPSIWRIAAIVQRENGHFVLDNVIYLKDKELDEESSLSEYLSAGCDGARWIGYGKQQAGLQHRR
jgi:hypothetical protein